MEHPKRDFGIYHVLHRFALIVFGNVSLKLQSRRHKTVVPAKNVRGIVDEIDTKHYWRRHRSEGRTRVYTFRYRFGAKISRLKRRRLIKKQLRNQRRLTRTFRGEAGKRFVSVFPYVRTRGNNTSGRYKNKRTRNVGRIKTIGDSSTAYFSIKRKQPARLPR